MTKIIYHEVRKGIACPDGEAAAWVCAKVYPNAEIIGCVYDEEPPSAIADGEQVVIVDFSFSNTQLEALADRGCKVLVLDHHKTAWENLQNLSARITAKYDVEQCGATMTWQHFFPRVPMPAFLSYVKDRDLWEHQLPLTHEIHTALGTIGRSFALYNALEKLSQVELGLAFGKFGAKLLAEKQLLVASIADRSETIEIKSPLGTYNIPGVYLSAEEGYLTSDICQQLYTVDYPDAPFVCCITAEGIYSLRSNKDGSNFDVGELAKSMGGGGHCSAAGFNPNTRAKSTDKL
jgi:uncharacterized protein